jgi:hypothetical protein
MSFAKTSFPSRGGQESVCAALSAGKPPFGKLRMNRTPKQDAGKMPALQKPG